MEIDFPTRKINFHNLYRSTITILQTCSIDLFWTRSYPSPPNHNQNISSPSYDKINFPTYTRSTDFFDQLISYSITITHSITRLHKNILPSTRNEKRAIDSRDVKGLASLKGGRTHSIHPSIVVNKRTVFRVTG